MSLEKVRDFFGIKYLVPYNLTTRKPYLILRAIGEISFESQIDAVELTGGHADAPYDIEYGQPSPTLTGTVREYPSELYELLETADVTENSAEVSGYVGTPENREGTSIFGVSNKVSNVTAHPSLLSSLIFGEYILVATGTQTLALHVNGLTDEFTNMEGLLVSGISTTGSGSVQVSAAGIVLTITGTPNYTVGDTASFEVRPVNTGSTEIIVGSGTTPTEFGVRCIFPRKSDGVLHWIDIFNVSARGLPWKAVSREFSEFEINWKPKARASDAAVYQMVRCLSS